MKEELNNWHYTPLKEIATYERARTRKIYRKGSFCVPISACTGRPIKYLEEDSEVEAEVNYVVVTPLDKFNPQYVLIVFEQQWERIKTTYMEGINLPFNCFDVIEIPLHKDRTTQDYIAKYMELLNKEMETTEKEIEHLKNMKEFNLKYMFV